MGAFWGCWMKTTHCFRILRVVHGATWDEEFCKETGPRISD